ncbi:hypothetical protein Moror_7104 [Moniliophthora roreri MCA 2997]|uniref:Protein kinase domain-containing protein n=2 Tax=Moniliophthora roreri TaxID=221103 RepID=V2XAV4_MONRO|nr:hypothetical protein Moror_7104 [Moniliophthora roreri MCA 2997]KAI3608439.1 hypothetical protein WG66_000985 [Moniliophthora roreri]
MNNIWAGDSQTIDIVKEFLRAILTQENAHEVLLSLDSRCIPPVVEILQSEVLSNPSRGISGRRQRHFQCLRALVGKHNILPSSLLLRNLTCEGMHAVRGGSFSDIWKGFFEEKPVCLKVMRIHLEANEQTRTKAFCEEALIWKQLEHPHILPLLGVNTELFSPAFCLVSPWMGNGDIITYLKKNPTHDRLRSVHEIASGLAYLHSLEPNIIHGDIKGANILVDNKRSCRLADFGLATIIETERVDSTTSSAIKGTVRWMAPEMFAPKDEAETNNSEAKWPRDIYAFACTIFEIMTGEPPFANLSGAAVMFKVITGVRPARPVDGWCPDKMWRLVERCWAQDPGMRPRATQLEKTLQRAAHKGTAVQRRGAARQDSIDNRTTPNGPRQACPDYKSSSKYTMTKSSLVTVQRGLNRCYPIGE